jgi:hypothetical protein
MVMINNDDNDDDDDDDDNKGDSINVWKLVDSVIVTQNEMNSRLP